MTNNTLTEHFTRAKNQYFTPRTEGEPDLIGRLLDTMILLGFTTEQISVFANDPTVTVAKERNSAVQRFVINRFWTTQLYIAPDNTEELRRLLFPEGDLLTWIGAVEQNILPFALSKGLPIAIN